MAVASLWLQRLSKPARAQVLGLDVKFFECAECVDVPENLGGGG